MTDRNPSGGSPILALLIIAIAFVPVSPVVVLPTTLGAQDVTV